jgi:uncharacterized Rmd1/YagE family protein
MKIEAYQIAELIHLKKFRQDFTQEPLVFNTSELFYKQGEYQYLYLLSYGVVIFAGFNDLRKSELLKFIKEYSENEVTGTFIDDLYVNVDPNVPLSIQYDSVVLSKLTEDSLRIILLNIGQSVALDYFETLSFDILRSTKKFTDELESLGNIRISKTNLLKFIGRTLNIKHSIIDNLYIFDVPDIVWENEFLEKLDSGLKRIFDIRMRYRDIDYRLKIVQENLTLFTDLLQNRESNRLEWIIIVLILIEVIHLIINQLF